MLLKIKMKWVNVITYYSVYDEQIKELRTDFSYYKDKVELKVTFEKHMIDIRDVSPYQVEQVWNELDYSIIETPLNFINEADKKVLYEIANGDYQNIERGWFDDLNAVKSEIKSIIAFKEYREPGAWYVIFTHTQKPLVIKHRYNDVNTYHIMYHYRFAFGLDIHEMSIKTFQ